MMGGVFLPPVIRANAAAGVLGAPKIASSKAQKVTPGKMPRAVSKAAPVGARAQPKAAPKAMPKAQPQANAGYKPLVEMSPAEINRYAADSVQKNTQAELVPYHQRAGEISSTEQTVANRYGGYGESTQKLMSGIQGEQQASAKTFANQAADAVAKSQGEVNTTGQNAITNNAGYEDPQLRAQLAAESANVTGIGAAQQASSGALGQGEANFLTNIRAAAANRVAEGQRGITSTFGKQRAENQGKESQLLAKQSGLIAKERNALTQTQFSDQSVRNKQALEAGYKGAQIELGRQNANTKERATSASERNNREKNALSGEKLKLAAGTQGFKEWATREDTQIKRLSAVDKSRYDEAQIRVKEATAKGKTPNPKEGRKYMNNLATAESIASANGVGPGKTGKALAEAKVKAEEAMVKAAKGATINREEVEAAMNLAYYGRLSTADQAVAISYGLTPEIRPEWFRSK